MITFFGDEKISQERTGLREVFTLGHSNHSLGDFLKILQENRIEVLVDARSQPYSRYLPHFSRESLQQAVNGVSIRYLFMGDSLGGRPKQADCYDTQGNVLYNRIREKEFFKEGIRRLVNGIDRYRVCVLCSEENPRHCHRCLLIGRALVDLGIDVQHIRGNGSLETEQTVSTIHESNNQQRRQLTLF
jgi:uncharacterized protein (DUF488 family)